MESVPTDGKLFKEATMAHSLRAATVLAAAAALLLPAGCKKDKAQCGDGIMEGQETCDGRDFNGDNCQKHGYLGGTLTCGADCSVVTFGGCLGGCGNGRKDGGEECDMSDLGGDTCQLHGFNLGTPACKGDCTLDLSACRNAACGNGTIEYPVESCEPGVALERTCKQEGFDAGDISCFPVGSDTPCRFDTSKCVSWDCGNHVVDPGEDCDFDADGNPMLDGESCDTIGYDGGTLGCNPVDFATEALRCKFDVTACTSFECGNSAVEGDEQCEADVAITAQCTDHGFTAGGPITCTTDDTCRFVFTACTGGCGNGLKEGTEECDGEDIGGADCASVSGGALVGDLRCKSTCEYDMSLCRTP